MRQAVLAVALLATLSFAACGHHPPTRAPTSAAGRPGDSAPCSSAHRPAPPAPSGSTSTPASRRWPRTRSTAWACSATIHFDFDKADMREGDRAVLAKNAEVLKKFDFLKVTVEGHCDERGTVEYNLALGERRAKAAYDYLVSLGVPADRLKTVSYGKEIPVCSERERGLLGAQPPGEVHGHGKDQPLSDSSPSAPALAVRAPGVRHLTPRAALSSNARVPGMSSPWPRAPMSDQPEAKPAAQGALGPDRQVRHRAAPRQGRHGHGLPRPRHHPRARRGPQGHGRADRRRPRAEAALRARGQGRREDDAPQRGDRLRPRQPHRRLAVHRDGAPEGPGPPEGDAAAAAPDPRAQGRDHRAGAGRASPTPTRPGSSTATSSPRTSSSTRTAR